MTSKPSPKPSLTVEEETAALNFLKDDGWIISAVKDTDVPRVMIEFARASRRRTLEEVIAKLKAAAPKHDDGMYGGIATEALNAFADELESELKKEQPCGK